MELRNFFKKNQIKDIAKKEQDFYQKNPRKKFLKIFAAASLALITCATTLLATAPFGSGAANVAATNTNLSNTTQTTSPLGLDPENDPVLFKTSSGLEIKMSLGGSFSSGYMNGYPYFTLGNYSGYDINWVVIGVSSTFFSKTTSVINGGFENTSSAGRAIAIDNLWHGILSSTQIISSLPANCLLVISEKIIKSVSTYSHWSSDLSELLVHANMQSIISECALASYKDNTIQKVTTGFGSTDTFGEGYCFALSKTEIETYMPNKNSRITTTLSSDTTASWISSTPSRRGTTVVGSSTSGGYYVWGVDASGNVAELMCSHHTSVYSHYVRPALIVNPFNKNLQ